MINPLLAACERGYVPDQVELLSNPSVKSDIDDVVPLIETIGAEYGIDLTIHWHRLSDETDFGDIVASFQQSIESTDETTSVAVDITPGRKFMSAIAFQAGIRYGADHVYYLLLDSEKYYGQIYPDIPRTATELIDFTEVV
jgi:hypothetical protein